MTYELTTRLLTSIHASRLIVLCGAGLSMAPPSSLPSAKEIAELCYDHHRVTNDPRLNPQLRGDLEALAGHFANLNSLETIFIETIVPWKQFIGTPNRGHLTIADFLIIRAFGAAISSNYDTLIERSAETYGFPFQSSLDGDEAIRHSTAQAPLLKIHGCCAKDRLCTIWTPSQLNHSNIATRMTKTKSWMTTNLRQKDLLIVGFWSDWRYLNTIISDALRDTLPRSVVVVDQSSTEQLRQKAPDLWRTFHTDEVDFEHVQQSASEALGELRDAFSKSYLRQVFADGTRLLEETIGGSINEDWLTVDSLDSESLYSWRRDAEGVNGNDPATRLQPSNSTLLGFFHLLLRRAGAIPRGTGYELHGYSIRVINGAGGVLSDLRAKFTEPPALADVDYIVAVGATNLRVPGNIVRNARPGDIVRSQPAGLWLDFDDARTELRI